MYVNLNKVIVEPDRQRKEFDPETDRELIESISSLGLINPITVRGGNILVAGERRLRAVRALLSIGEGIRYGGAYVPLGQIPANDVGEVSPVDAFATELDENRRRKALTWQEDAAATARLLDLQRKVLVSTGSGASVGDSPNVGAVDGAGEPTDRAAVEAVAFSLRGTGSVPDSIPHAKMIVGRREALATAIASGNKEVAAAKTEQEAFKILRRQNDRAENIARARQVGLLRETERYVLHKGDCIEYLRNYAGERFSCILTDPPYGMDAEAFGDGGSGRYAGITHEYNDTASSFETLMAAWFPLVTEVAAPDAALYLYCDIDNFHFLAGLARTYGWRVHRTPLIHLKRQGGRVPWPTSGPRRAYELVLYAIRGRASVTSIVPDVFDTSLSEGNLGHGAQKPVEGFVNLLRRSCRPGQLVLDPFAGTGTILVAAAELGLRVVAIENQEAAFGIASGRLESLLRGTPAVGSANVGGAEE